MNKLSGLVASALLICMTVGCSSDNRGDDPVRGAGELSLNMPDVDKLLQARAQDDFTPNTGDFKIEILDQSRAVVREFAKYSKMPPKVKLEGGDYIVRASCGSATQSGFEACQYAGEAPVTIVNQQTTTATVTCSLENAKVAVKYGTYLSYRYDSYRVELCPETAPKVFFSKNETRSAYVPAGNMEVVVYLYKEGDGYYTYTSDPIEVLPKDFIKLLIETDPNDGKLNLVIITDEDTDGREIVIELYEFMQGFPVPSVTGEGFDASGVVVFEEGTAPQAARINLKAEAMIRSCIVETDPKLQAAGWPASFDLADPDLNSGTADWLRGKSLKWFEHMNGSVLASINLAEVGRAIICTAPALAPEDYTFKVRITDTFDQESPQETFTLSILPRILILNEIVSTDMWASKTTLTGRQLFGGDPVALEMNSGGGWEACPAAELTRLADDNLRWDVKGLAPGTDYSFRMVYHSRSSNDSRGITEEAVQVPNSDFEDWYEYKAEDRSYINQYYLHPQGYSDPWWATRNPATAGQYTGVETAYTTVNTTFPRNENGSRAATMRTAAWGAGTTTAGAISVIYSIFSGVLYIGSYERTLTTGSTVWIPWEKLNTETITQGHAFPSRPAKLQFDYMYGPYNNDKFMAYAIIESGGTEIARADVTGINGVSQLGGMQTVAFDFVYSRTDLKATNIKILFSSSENMNNNGPPVAKSGIGGGPHWGSTLTVDNLYLDYAFD